MPDDKPFLKTAEHRLESVLFASRWLLAPFYLGLALSLIVLLIKFVAELGHIAAHAFTATESEVILGVLALVDLALTGSLIIIVIFSGYENFVSRIDHGAHKDWPEWMGKIDFSGLKLKLLSSIVAISGIQLLKQFMAINKVSDRDIMWLVIVHVVFVVSAVLLALSDRLTVHAETHPKKPDGNRNGGGEDHTPGPVTAGQVPGAPVVQAHSAQPAGASPAARTNIQVTRVEIQRNKPPATERPAATQSRVEPETGNHDDDPANTERLPTIKRRLH